MHMMALNGGTVLKSQQSKPEGQVFGVLLQSATVHFNWKASQSPASKPAHSLPSAVQVVPQPVGSLQTPASQISASAQSSLTVHSGGEPVVLVAVSVLVFSPPSVPSPPSPPAPDAPAEPPAPEPVVELVLVVLVVLSGISWQVLSAAIM